MNEIEVEKETQDEDQRPKEKKQEKADLEKVTDYAEEKEITNVNVDNLQAINKIEAERFKLAQAKEEELAKVEIKREDVQLVSNEMEITTSQAELALRQNKGDVVQALVSLLC